MRVVVGTGGTAGHVFPAIATAERLRDRGVDVRFVGRAGALEDRLAREAGFPMETVDALPFVRKLSLAALRAPFAALRAAQRARGYVRGANVVLGMGGYVSVPVALAARGEGVPLVLHEQNAKLGLANRVASRWARAVALSFPEAEAGLPRRVPRTLTGNPVRAQVARVARDREELAHEAIPALDLEAGRRTVVVMGGSQGALRVNRAAVDAARLLSERRDLQILLITGQAHLDAVRGALPESGPLVVRTMAFLDRIELAYAVADLVVGRAGATTVAEVAACGLPALLVPYPYATARHQEANARVLQRAGGATVLLDDECTGPALAERLEALIDHDERLVAMARGSAAFGRPEAAGALADLATRAASAPSPEVPATDGGPAGGRR